MALSSSKKHYKLLKTCSKVQYKNTLTLHLQLENDEDEYYISHESEVFKINGTINFEVRVMSVASSDTFMENVKYFNTFYVRASNINKPNTYTSFVLTSNALQQEKRRLDVGNDNTWRLISLWRSTSPNLYMDIEITVEDPRPPQPTANSVLVALHDDSNLTDFELRGEDGAVRVHKAVVAAASPVLRAMLEGQWREAEQGSTKVADATHATLQHLKEYLYLNKIPEGDDVKKLLLLANYYQMTELRERCMGQVVSSITTDNLMELTEFAVRHAITDLHFQILESVQKGDNKHPPWYRVGKCVLFFFLAMIINPHRGRCPSTIELPKCGNNPNLSNRSFCLIPAKKF